MFIDIHTHRRKNEPKTVEICSFRYGMENIEYGNYTAVGVHPWDVAKNIDISGLEARLSPVIAIGEIGLDRHYPDFELQKQYFIAQLEIARKINKVVVVHTVKSHNETIEILKSYRDLTIIIHSFIGNDIIAKEYIDLGCYLSFSPLSFRSTRATEALKKVVPLNHLFLESDISEIAIDKIYTECSEVLKISIDELKNEIFNNFKRIFKEYV